MHQPQPQWALPCPVTIPVELHLPSVKMKSLCGASQGHPPACPFVPAPTSVSGDSLWVQLVQRAIHTHGDLEVLEALVFSPLLHDGSQAGAAHLGSPPGHGPAHLLHHNTVFTRAVQTQLLQDPPDLQEGQSVTVNKQSRTSAVASRTWTCFMGSRVLSAWLCLSLRSSVNGWGCRMSET